MHNGLFYSYQIDEYICKLRVVRLVGFYRFYLIRRNNRLPYVNRADPGHVAASKLGLHRLHKSFYETMGNRGQIKTGMKRLFSLSHELEKWFVLL